MVARHDGGLKCSLQVSVAGHAAQIPAFLDFFSFQVFDIGIVDLSCVGCAGSHLMGGER